MGTQPAKQPSRNREADERSSMESAQTCARPSNGVVHDGAGVGGTAQSEQFIDVAAVWVNLSALHPWPNNPTRDDPASVRRVAESIKRFGFGAPLVVRKQNGEIIAGHTRFKAAQLLKLASVPVRMLDITEQDAHALALADNRLAALTLRNNEALAAALRDIPNVDQVIAGYEQPDIDKLLRELQGEPEIIEDQAPEPPKVPVTKLGDVWTLGRHRLVCGDCRVQADVNRGCAGASVNLAFTSPPYASQRKYDAASGFEPIEPDAYVQWFEPVQANVRAVLAADGSWFVNIKPSADGLDTSLYVFDLVIAHVRAWGWHFATEFCWERNGFPGKPQRRFKNKFEPIYQFALGDWKFCPDAVVSDTAREIPIYDKRSHWASGLNDRTAGHKGDGWARLQKGGSAYPGNRLSALSARNDIDGSVAMGHAAVFPIGLPAFFIRAYTDLSDTVLDPFIGSGTTLIAAEQLERSCVGIELSPAYCDVIVERWQNLTGQKAKRE